jgi:hypothetical protein
VFKKAFEDEGYTSHGYRQPSIHGSGTLVLNQGGSHHSWLLLQIEGEVDDSSKPLAENYEGR